MTETPKPPSDTQKPTKSDEDPNLSRIESAVKFLHSKGQFNIILIGYGRSAERILSYSNNADAEGMKRNIRSKASSAMKRPIRAMVLINPQSTDGHSISPQLALFNYLDMPILDMTIGTHYLDVMNAKSRKSNARSAGFENYIQLKVTEPSSTVFGQENRLSRRVRGFLNKYAKGVEVDRR